MLKLCRWKRYYLCIFHEIDSIPRIETETLLSKEKMPHYCRGEDFKRTNHQFLPLQLK
jgi:hypothetical protein